MKRKDGAEWGMPDPEVSRARLDPMANLTAAILRQAVEDYQGKDLLHALDAFAWLVFGDTADLLDLLELDLPEDENILFRRLVTYEKKNTRAKIGRSAVRADTEHERFRIENATADPGAAVAGVYR